MKNLIINIKNLISEIDDITDLFYMQKNKLAFERFNVTLVNLSNIIDEIFRYCNNEINLEFNANNLFLSLTEGLQAMEIGDSILLADILKYEIKEQLIKFNNAVQ
ncbi:MAG: hypothetical protein K0S41_1560 [Anaerocolumna sp.]|jgi:hypothetical protein|nr:hypothetical protein [Anaerocolumna sp.]